MYPNLGINYNQESHELLAFKILSNNLTTAVLTLSISYKFCSIQQLYTLSNQHN